MSCFALETDKFLCLIDNKIFWPVYSNSNTLHFQCWPCFICKGSINGCFVFTGNTTGRSPDCFQSFTNHCILFYSHSGSLSVWLVLNHKSISSTRSMRIGRSRRPRCKFKRKTKPAGQWQYCKYGVRTAHPIRQTLFLKKERIGCLHLGEELFFINALYIYLF